MMCIRIAAQSFANIDMPMGGKITSVDADHIELVIPRIQLFDVWLQPRTLAALRWGSWGYWVTWGLITQVGTLGHLGAYHSGGDGTLDIIRLINCSRAQSSQGLVTRSLLRWRCSGRGGWDR